MNYTYIYVNLFLRYTLCTYLRYTFAFILDNDKTNEDTFLSENQNTSQNTTKYKPSDESESSLEINETEVRTSLNGTNEINTISENNEAEQFKFNIPGNSACDETKLASELSHVALKVITKKTFVYFVIPYKAKYHVI